MLLIRIAKSTEMDLLSLTDIRCVLSLYHVQSALKVKMLHQYNTIIYME